MGGNKEGIWSINYSPSGTQAVSASPEGVAKLWDTKGGKSTAELRAHTKKVMLVIDRV